MADRQLDPILPTPMPRDDPDGTTAFSDEAGLPGNPRLLAWTVVQETEATFDIHAMWDTNDIHDAMNAAIDHARDFLGPRQFRSGIVWGTLNSADNAVRKRYRTDGFIN